MYSNEQLSEAVDEGIFTQSAIDEFKHFVASKNHTNMVDEENFRLITGFNDIFVVIASALLLGSLTWLGYSIMPMMGGVALALGSWLLAEYFVVKRRMALPAIALLLSFLAGTFAAPIMFNNQPTEMSFTIAGLLTVAAAFLHWRRFRVPITIAAGAVAMCGSILAVLVTWLVLPIFWINTLTLVAGLLIFGLAMYWDASDRTRQTRASDVAFWLHLAAAPMIVHSIFSSIGIIGISENPMSAVFVVLVYVLLAMVSIAVDRRAIMVSALAYVVYAFSSLLQTYGMVSYSFAITGLCIGATLLLLSAFWQGSRKSVLAIVPDSLKNKLPELQASS